MGALWSGTEASSCFVTDYSGAYALGPFSIYFQDINSSMLETYIFCDLTGRHTG